MKDASESDFTYRNDEFDNRLAGDYDWLRKQPYAVGASMTREYDVFEKFPDGSSLWRVSVSGLGNARLQLHELTRRSDNQFYAIDITGGKTFHLDREREMLGFHAPRKTRSRTTARIARPS